MTVRTLIGAKEITAQVSDVPTVRVWLRGLLPNEPRDVIDDMALALTEVVTNAIKHSRSGVVITDTGVPGRIYLAVLCMGRALRAEVTDEGPRKKGSRPRIKANGQFSETGRGLAIVNTVSLGRWGVERHTPSAAVTVWFEVAKR